MSRKDARGTDPPPPLIVGYGAVYYDGTPSTEYQIFDDIVERIMPGAFDRVGLANGGEDCRCCFNHNLDFILGRESSGSLVLRVDNTGLAYDVLPAPDSRMAQDVVSAIRRRDVTGSSVTFICHAEAWIDRPGGGAVREMHEMEIIECGPVVFPAYEGTTAEARAGDVERRFLPAAIAAVHLVDSGTRVDSRLSSHTMTRRRGDPVNQTPPAWLEEAARKRIRAAEVLAME